MEFLSEPNNASAVDVISFVREVMERFPNLRSTIIHKLLESFRDMRIGRVYRGALWIVGEYAMEKEAIESTFHEIRSALGEIPILASEERLLQESLMGESHTGDGRDTEVQEVKSPVTAEKKKILADGTYATESAFSAKSTTFSRMQELKAQLKPSLRGLFFSRDLISLDD